MVTAYIIPGGSLADLVDADASEVLLQQLKSYNDFSTKPIIIIITVIILCLPSSPVSCPGRVLCHAVP